jgi:hypothetical protein
LTRVERRQLTVLAVATLAGLVLVIIGVILLVPGDDRLGPLLMLTGTLIVSAAGFLSMRRLLPLQRRRFHAAAIGVIALLWIVSIVGYLRGWQRNATAGDVCPIRSISSFSRGCGMLV